MDNRGVDNIVKKYFDSRNIDPSDRSWDQIESLLQVKEKPGQTKVSFYWIAASFALIIVTICFWVTIDKNSTRIPADKLSSLPYKKSKFESENKETKELTYIKIPFVNVNKNSYKNKKYGRKDVQSFEDKLVSGKNELIEKRNLTSDSKKVTPESLSITLNSKSTDDISGGTKNRKSISLNSGKLLTAVENQMVNDSKTDRDIELRKKYGIDPDELLLEAENASHQTFMSKVFKSLTEKSGTVFAVVENRNYLKK